MWVFAYRSTDNVAGTGTIELVLPFADFPTRLDYDLRPRVNSWSFNPGENRAHRRPDETEALGLPL